ncbi:MAG TPA: MBOAT family O-acyltransferase [Steroidobacteraceae bacterium]|nr:MBOAT family O-acyltransferase [Steroidobacteraceae bacterium]
MSFTSAAFLGFLGGVALLHALLPRVARAPLLLIASYAFYALYSGYYALLLLASTLVAFLAGRVRSAALAGVALLIAALVLFKALPILGVGALIPLGISYYTFKLSAYLIDRHWGAVESEGRLVPFLTFTAFFPQIVGGPIQRAPDFLPQLAAGSRVSPDLALKAVMRICLGFFKKFVVADNLAPIVNYVYAHLGAHPGAPVLLGFYGYPLQMYADFSGLTDIALGAGALVGIIGPENFAAPFAAPSPSEYWRRWHMSLTTWMVDYVFTPLRMALRRFGNAGLVASLFINMILIGLWHGFYLTFALFGVVHACYMTIDALTQKARKRLYKRHPSLDRLTDVLGPLITFHLIAVAFVFFRADSVATVGAFFAHLTAGLEPLAPAFHYIIDQPGSSIGVLGAALVLMEAGDWVRRRFWSVPLPGLPRWGRWSLVAATGLSILLTAALLMTSSSESNPFLYAIF